MAKIIPQIFKGIVKGDIEQTQKYVQVAIDNGMSPSEILYDGLIPPMVEVGHLYEDGEFFVPEMLISAHAMKAGLGIIKPLLLDEDIQPIGRVVLGTVKGDLHDIGKNLVGMMLEGAGFNVKDLGADVSPETFVNAIRTYSPDIVAMSALLTTTMPYMEATIMAIEEIGIREKVTVIVGGAPVTSEFAEKIGADGFAPDASQAANLAKKIMKR